MGFRTAQVNPYKVKVDANDASAGYLIDKLLEGSNITFAIVTDIDGNERIEISSSGGGGGSFSISNPTGGTIDDSNLAFTFSAEPTALVINGGIYKKTGGAITWSWSAGTATLSSPVGTGGTIFGIS